MEYLDELIKMVVRQVMIVEFMILDNEIILVFFVHGGMVKDCFLT